MTTAEPPACLVQLLHFLLQSDALLEQRAGVVVHIVGKLSAISVFPERGGFHFVVSLL